MFNEAIKKVFKQVFGCLAGKAIGVVVKETVAGIVSSFIEVSTKRFMEDAPIRALNSFLKWTSKKKYQLARSIQRSERRLGNKFDDEDILNELYRRPVVKFKNFINAAE